MNLIKDLESDEFPFINARIGGNLVDFEDTVASDTGFHSFWRNTVSGQIGENTI